MKAPLTMTRNIEFDEQVFLLGRRVLQQRSGTAMVVRKVGTKSS